MSNENFFFSVGFGILLLDVSGAERCLRRGCFEGLLEIFARLDGREIESLDESVVSILFTVKLAGEERHRLNLLTGN